MRSRGFTLIELLVSTAVATILLSILAFVFRLSIGATREANTRIGITERLRTITSRVRQEVGGMLPVKRASGMTYAINNSNSKIANVLTMASATNEDGRSVSVDVRYEFIPDAANPENGKIVRYRDATGPYDLAKPTLHNPAYATGDDTFAPQSEGSILLTNVRETKFEVIDPPPPPGNGIDPRELPAAIKMTLTFGAPNADPSMTETFVMTFPVYRGL